MALSASFTFLNTCMLTAAPDAAIAVLVGGEILEDRFQRLAVRVSGIFTGGMRAAGHTERVIGR